MRIALALVLLGLTLEGCVDARIALLPLLPVVVIAEVVGGVHDGKVPRYRDASDRECIANKGRLGEALGCPPQPHFP